MSNILELLKKLGLDDNIHSTDDVDTIGEKFLNNAKANKEKLKEMVLLLTIDEKKEAKFLVSKIEERINQMSRVKRGIVLHMYGDTLDELEKALS